MTSAWALRLDGEQVIGEPLFVRLEFGLPLGYDGPVAEARLIAEPALAEGAADQLAYCWLIARGAGEHDANAQRLP